jgi:hypothetical protein
MKRLTLLFSGILFSIVVMMSCYSFSGASIPPNIHTFSIDMFQNRATIVNPTLAMEMTDELRSFITSRSSLRENSNNPDIEITGEITAYTVTPTAAGADAVAALQRFSITVRVNFANNVTIADSFSQSFTRTEDFDSSIDFAAVEDGLKAQLIEQLVNDIFNKAFANW